MKVIIFGAGIAGLTVAHELLDKGFDVSIYEKIDSVGGFARSKRRTDGMPTEHSLRIYGIHYRNLFNILKRIPIKNLNKNNKKYTVYNNLDKPRQIINLHDKITNENIFLDLKPTFRDGLIITYYIMKCLLSNLRNKEYSKISMKSVFHKKISQKGYDKYATIVKFLNMKPELFSLFDSTKYIQETILTYHSHTRNNKEYNNWFSKKLNNVYFMNQPTSEAWFNIWIKYLQKKGLKLYLNSSLENIQINKKGKIEKCLITGRFAPNSLHRRGKAPPVTSKWIGTSSDIFVNCINPFQFQKILTHSKLLEIPAIQKTELIKFPYLTNRSVHNQIGFTLIFNKELKSPSNDYIYGHILSDSEFGVGFYIQNNVFKNDPYIKGGISVISGITTNPSGIGKLYGKTYTQLNKKQFLEEVKYQIFRSQEFISYIKKYYNIHINDLHVIDSNIWHEWSYDSLQGGLISNNPKWMTNMENLQYRPSQKSGISNLYIAGAHTKTSVHFWNMESAVESGKHAANYIIEQYNSNFKNKKNKVYLYLHESSIYLKPFQLIDDILYKLQLPNILDFLLIIIILWTTVRLLKI